MTNFAAPAKPLTDGVVTLRLPSAEAGDVEAVLGYIEQEQLDGGWLPAVPLVSAEEAVDEWVDAWSNRTSRHGPVFVATIPGERRFVGIVGLVDRGQGIVELIYGIAPPWRGRGLASRAVELAALWAASQPGVNTVELRIDRDMIECQHVAVNAGFAVAGTVTQFVPATGETFEDLRYVLTPPTGSPDSGSAASTTSYQELPE
jgi:RimJ/RimL family protein N-acetyltransferase